MILGRALKEHTRRSGEKEGFAYTPQDCMAFKFYRDVRPHPSWPCGRSQYPHELHSRKLMGPVTGRHMHGMQAHQPLTLRACEYTSAAVLWCHCKALDTFMQVCIWSVVFRVLPNPLIILVHVYSSIAASCGGTFGCPASSRLPAASQLLLLTLLAALGRCMARMGWLTLGHLCLSSDPAISIPCLILVSNFLDLQETSAK